MWSPWTPGTRQRQWMLKYDFVLKWCFTSEDCRLCSRLTMTTLCGPTALYRSLTGVQSSRRSSSPGLAAKYKLLVFPFVSSRDCTPFLCCTLKRAVTLIHYNTHDTKRSILIYTCYHQVAVWVCLKSRVLFQNVSTLCSFLEKELKSPLLY